MNGSSSSRSVARSSSPNNCTTTRATGPCSSAGSPSASATSGSRTGSTPRQDNDSGPPRLGSCRVPGCPRQPRTRQLCKGHYYRWQRRGKPDVEAFIADPGVDPVGRSELTACAVAGCRFGAARQGLCVRHHGFWERAGKPHKRTWVAGLPTVEDSDRRVCRLSFCTLWARGKSPFCHNHKSRWYAVGSPEIEEFVRRCEAAGDDRFDFRPLEGKRQLRLELQYALQRRHDERQVNTHSSAVAPVIRLVAASGTASLLEWSMERWSEYYAAGRGSSHSQNGQLVSWPSFGMRTRTWRTSSTAAAGRASSRAMCGNCAGSGSTAPGPGCGSTASPSRGCASWPKGSCAGG